MSGDGNNMAQVFKTPLDQMKAMEGPRNDKFNRELYGAYFDAEDNLIPETADDYFRKLQGLEDLSDTYPRYQLAELTPYSNPPQWDAFNKQMEMKKNLQKYGRVGDSIYYNGYKVVKAQPKDKHTESYDYIPFK